MPILYASHSAYANADLFRDLRAKGADPNASSEEEWGRSTALYGAAGVVHDPERTRVLLEAGADPDDNESLYHSTEAESPECLRLLLEHGAETRGTNALPRALEFDRIEPVRMLLEAGGDPNEWPILTHAIRRGRGPEFIRLLVEHGAELDRAGGEIEQWRQEVPPRTPYAQAILRGRDDVAEALAELGAATELDPGHAGVAALVRGDRSASLLDELDLDQQEAIIRSAMRGNLEATIEALGPDFHGVSDGSPDGTLLHHAAWHGDGEGFVSSSRAAPECSVIPTVRRRSSGPSGPPATCSASAWITSRSPRRSSSTERRSTPVTWTSRWDRCASG